MDHEKKKNKKHALFAIVFGMALVGMILGILNSVNNNNNDDDTGFLKIDGSNAMENNLNVGNHGITNTSFVNLLESFGVNPPAGSTNFFSTGAGNLTQITSDGTSYTFLTNVDSQDFLFRDGHLPMIGTLDMNLNPVLNATNILYLDGHLPMSGNLNMDNHVVRNMSFLPLTNNALAPNALSGTTNFFSTGPGNLTQVDDLGNLYTFTIGDFLLRNGTLPMTGNLNLNGHDINNINQLHTSIATSDTVFGFGNTIGTPNSTNILIGNVNTVTNATQSILVGSSNTFSGTSGTLIGKSSTNSGNANAIVGVSGNNILGNNLNIFGSNITANAGASNCLVFGSSCLVGNFSDGGLFGSGNTIAANNTFVIGNNTTNAQSNSVQLGQNISNLIPNNAASHKCDIGLNSVAFNNAWLQNNVYLNGNPASIAEFSSFSQTIVSGDSSEHDFTSGLSGVGTLLLPALQSGAYITYELMTSITTTGADSLQIFFNVGASTHLETFNFSTGVTVTNSTAITTWTISVQNTTTAVVTIRGQSGSSLINFSLTNNASLNSTTSNLTSFSARWSSGVGSTLTCVYLNATSQFRTA